MTTRQQYILLKVQEQIRTTRQMLDDVMYRTDPLTEEEHKRVRGAYDKICEANDLL
jgi:hypothetical protein